MRKFRLKKRYIFIAGGIIAAGIFFLLSVTHELTVTYYEIKTDKVSTPVRIALITDLHSSIFGENQEDLISLINAQKPDIIALAGDIADPEYSNDGTVMLLEGIADKYPCFYVTGNHEITKGNENAMKSLFREYGVTILEGSNVTVEINGQYINLVGVDDPHEIGAYRRETQLENGFAGIDENLYTVFLFHRPERFPSVAGYNFDLMLAGHAHGGQWRIPFTNRGIYAPNQGFFPRYTAGLYELENRKMIISRGLSLNHPPIIPRLLNPPEVVIVDILPNSN